MMACPVAPLTSLNTLANWRFICVSAFCILGHKSPLHSQRQILGISLECCRQSGD